MFHIIYETAISLKIEAISILFACACLPEKDFLPWFWKSLFIKWTKDQTTKQKHHTSKKCISDMKVVGTDLNLRYKVDLQKDISSHISSHKHTQLYVLISLICRCLQQKGIIP